MSSTTSAVTRGLWKRMYEKNDMEKTAKKARLEEVKERSTTKVKEEKTPPRRK